MKRDLVLEKIKVSLFSLDILTFKLTQVSRRSSQSVSVAVVMNTLTCVLLVYKVQLQEVSGNA